MVSQRILGSAVALAAAVYAQDEADATVLAPNAIQTGSFFDGQQALGAADDQARALTSQNNFINFCAGQTLTDGLQILDGSCNGIPMGQIPAKANMITTVILNPQDGDVLQAGVDFNIELQTNGLIAGAFTNAIATYYSAPQFLQNGNVVGHTHVTVQDLGSSLNPTVPPDPQQFAFFKGINDQGNGDGFLFAEVLGGLPPGNFRVCTLTSGSNHQPVIMPVAQRGAQDDCIRFTVVLDLDDVSADDVEEDDVEAADVEAADVEAADVEVEEVEEEDNNVNDILQNLLNNQNNQEEEEEVEVEEEEVEVEEEEVEVEEVEEEEEEESEEIDLDEFVNDRSNGGINGLNSAADAAAAVALGPGAGALQALAGEDIEEDEEEVEVQEVEEEEEVEVQEVEEEEEESEEIDLDEFANDRSNGGINGLNSAADAAAAVALGPGAGALQALAGEDIEEDEEEVEVQEVEEDEEEADFSAFVNDRSSGGINGLNSAADAAAAVALGPGALAPLGDEKRRRAVHFSS